VVIGMTRDTLVTAILLACAMTMTGVVLHREFFASPEGRVRAEQKPIFVKDWRTDLPKGTHIGSAQAPIQLLEFADFECPYCATFYKDLKALRVRYPTQVELTFVHFPIRGHRFAIPAARAAECAADQGRFEAMYDQLFEGQDQFGLKPWGEFAAAAGVPDLVGFDACIKMTDPIARVEEGKALGAKLDAKGTPTVIINGWMLGRPPTEDELDAMVKKILAGKSPVDGKS
jgi:protein-disulfide isomerase